MQCMMKEICAQCMQLHKDPQTGKETVVFSCFNQDQSLDSVDWSNLRTRLSQNSVQEKVTKQWIDRCLRQIEPAKSWSAFSSYNQRTSGRASLLPAVPMRTRTAWSSPARPGVPERATRSASPTPSPARTPTAETADVACGRRRRQVNHPRTASSTIRNVAATWLQNEYAPIPRARQNGSAFCPLASCSAISLLQYLRLVSVTSPISAPSFFNGRGGLPDLPAAYKQMIKVDGKAGVPQVGTVHPAGGEHLSERGGRAL